MSHQTSPTFTRHKTKRMRNVKFGNFKTNHLRYVSCQVGVSNLHQSLQCGIWQFLQHTQQAKRFEIFTDRSIFCQTDECQAPLSACFINSPLFLVCRECVFFTNTNSHTMSLSCKKNPIFFFFFALLHLYSVRWAWQTKTKFQLVAVWSFGKY